VINLFSVEDPTLSAKVEARNSFMVHSAEDEPLISRNFTPHEPVTLFFFLKKEKVTKPHDVRGYTDSLV